MRLLHGAMVVLVPLAWLSGLLVFGLHDGRWGRLPWPLPGDWIDIHGTVGVMLWPLALLFGAYALSLGRYRLRLAANGAPLLALTLAVACGKLMDEDWLPQGELHHLAYSLHLTAWLLLAVTVIWHGAATMARATGPPSWAAGGSATAEPS